MGVRALRHAVMASAGLAALAGLGVGARADVSMPSIFGDHMVLQRDAPVPIWGKADPGERVTVRLAGQERSVVADEAGRWIVRMAPITSSQPLELVVEGNNTLTFGNVAMGEVWLCSGQSNMDWKVKDSADAPTEIASADWPDIRFFNTSPAKQPAQTPRDDVEARWEVCSPDTVATFSAVGYYFGRRLHKELGDVPVGLINVSWGGMPAEAFTPIEALRGNPALQGVIKRFDDALTAYPQAKAEYDRKLSEWEARAKSAEARGEPPPARPRAPLGPDSPSAPGVLWNGLVHPVRPYAIRGVIWYQGESNAGRAVEYRELLPAMITAWRQAWGQGDFPFLIVQLANYRAPATQPVEPNSDWALLREAQAMTLERVPNAGLAVTIDIGDADDIHPKNKQEVGRRLALSAEKIAYGRDVVHSGPTFKAMAVEGRIAVLAFENTGAGLVVKGGALEGFAISGEDGGWHAGEATIADDGRHVMVWSPSVDRPTAVRYGWANNPPATLYNKEGLPAGPFRTDRE